MRTSYLLPALLVLGTTGLMAWHAERDDRHPYPSTGKVVASRDSIRQHLYYLASDDLGGRATGSLGFEVAVEYVVHRLEIYGLEPMFASHVAPSNKAKSYKQPFRIQRWKTAPDGGLTIRRGADTETLDLLDDIQVAHWSPDPDFRSPLPLVYLGVGISEPDVGWDDLSGLELEGKCAVGLYDSPADLTQGLREDVWRRYAVSERGAQIKFQRAARRGASCVIAIPGPDAPVDWDEMIESRDHLSRIQFANADGSPLLPGVVAFMASTAATEKLFAGQPHQALPGGRPTPFDMRDITVQWEGSLRRTSEVGTTNVGAILPGTDPTLRHEVILLTAHLDGQGMRGGEPLNSANDNASSVAALLEAARLLTALPARRSIFVLFPGAEEGGLLGSRYFVEKPPISLDRIRLNINMEMVGKRARSGPYAFRVTTRLTPDLEALAVATEKAHGGVDFDHALRFDTAENKYRRSDHANFFLRGIPTIYFHGRNGADYHEPSDDADRIDVGKVAALAEVLVELVGVTDGYDQLPRQVRLP